MRATCVRRGTEECHNAFYNDGGRGASSYKDLRGGARCAVTDSQFADWTFFSSKSAFYF